MSVKQTQNERRRASIVNRMSHFDFRNLAYLEAAITSGSVRRGAEILNTSPSALSRQIAKMELELGVPLLERHGRGVRATEAGTLFLQYFGDQRKQIDAIVQGIWEILGLHRGAVTVALGRGFGDEFMKVLKEFSDEHPSVQINLLFGSTDYIVQKIVEDDAHVGLAYKPPNDPKINSLAHRRHPMCAVVRPNHPLARLERKIRLTDLRGYDLGLPPGRYGIRQTLLNAEDLEHVMLAPKLVANSTGALSRFAEEWGGVIVSPRFAVEGLIQQGRLVAVEFEEPFLQNCEAHLFVRHGRKQPPAALALLQALRASLSLVREPRQS